MAEVPACRFCGAPLTRSFVDLGRQPVSNALVDPAARLAPEPFYPLHARVCDACHLVQIEDVGATHFDAGYVYFSSYSEGWLAHCREFAGTMIDRLGLGPDQLVVEIASNDGYLLQYFKAAGVPVLGVEPSANTARVAQDRHGIDSRIAFFGRQEAAAMRAEGLMADLIVANNVLAHVPDIRDFTAGFRAILKPGGTVSFEFPHLLRLIEGGQFDTIYHEHYSYLSLLAVERILAEAGLAVSEVEEIATHGGSLRVLATHGAPAPAPGPGLLKVRAEEAAAGLDGPAAYDGFAERARETRRDLLSLLIDLKRKGRRIVGYGAPAKGNTLLNYCGIGRDVIDFTVDRNPVKQGKLLPGTGIAIHPPEALFAARPDHVLILPWNLRAEIIAQTAAIRDWGGSWIVPIPRPEIVQ